MKISNDEDVDDIVMVDSHDDILVGHKGSTYWFEIKTGPKADIKDSQRRLLKTWAGHYKIVWSIDMILEDLGLI